MSESTRNVALRFVMPGQSQVNEITFETERGAFDYALREADRRQIAGWQICRIIRWTERSGSRGVQKIPIAQSANW